MVARVLAPDGRPVVSVMTLMWPGKVIVDAGDDEKNPRDGSGDPVRKNAVLGVGALLLEGIH